MCQFLPYINMKQPQVCIWPLPLEPPSRVQTTLKVLIELGTTLFLFYALVFWPRRMWHVAPQPGMEPTAPATEGKVLTTGPQGSPKSLDIFSRASTPEHCGQRGALGQLGLLPLLPDKDCTSAWVWPGVHQGPGRASHQLGQSQEPSHPRLRSLLQLTAPASLPFVK